MSREKLIKATHQGTLEINGISISCAVLEDGTRVISERSVSDALGAKASGQYWRKRKQGDIMPPRYLYANFLTPFISTELLNDLQGAIRYSAVSGKEAIGVRAEILPDICDVWIVANEKGAIPENQLNVAEQAYSLLKGFAKVGIIALVDEATGYQYEREKDELQKILKSYISEELLPWQKRFPDVFYKELFRLNGWDFTVKGIKKRPGIVGTWTNTLIYEQLPNGVLEELKKKTPKNESGKLKGHLHRSLTTDVGDPHLTQQINQITTLFMLSDNMKDMWNKFERLRIRQVQQLELPFQFDNKGHTIEPVEKVYNENSLSEFNQKLKKALDYDPKKDKRK